jgi:hypothetical protein
MILTNIIGKNLQEKKIMLSKELARKMQGNVWRISGVSAVIGTAQGRR